MQEVYLLSKDEKKEMESVSNVMLSIFNSFETFTADTIDGETNDEKLDSIEELRDAMAYDMRQLEKAYDVMREILNGDYDGKTSIKDYELGK